MRTNKEFQEIVNQGKGKREIVELYQTFMSEEIDEFIEAYEEKSEYAAMKECCDIAIVCQPVIDNGRFFERLRAKLFKHASRLVMKKRYSFKKDDFEKAEIQVVKSNFSKFIEAEDTEFAKNYFKDKGINVELKQISDGLYSAVSTEDQTVSGKFYKKGKVLKGPFYEEVNESIKFW